MDSLFLNNFTSLVRGDWNNVDVQCRKSNRFTPMHYIIEQDLKPLGVDSLDRIESLVALGADVNAKDRYHQTPLHLAVLYNDTESIECLLELGADINAQCQLEVTSLSEAVRLNNVQAVRVLAQLGLVQSVGDVLYTTVLTCQMLQRNMNMLKYLMYKGANINATADYVPIINAAIKSGNIEIVQILLEHGAAVNKGNAMTLSNVSIVMDSLFSDITEPEWFTELKNLGADFNLPATESSAVYEAVTSRRLDIIELLIKYKAVMGRMVRETPIARTLQKEQFGLLEHLIIKCGADINARYEPFCMTIDAACRTGNIDIVKALWERQSAVDDSRCSKELTVLLFKLLQVRWDTETSSLLKEVWAIKKLIGLGASVNTRFDMYNELHTAVVRGDVNMVEELVRFGLNVDGTTCNIPPLIAWLNVYDEVNTETDSQIHKDVVRSLLEAGANPNEPYDSKTPLLLAVERSDIEMVRTLARLGTNMDQFGITHLTPIHLVLIHAVTVDTLDLLIEHGGDPNAEYGEGLTPLFAALESRNTEMVQCLLQCEAQPIVGVLNRECTAMSLALQVSDYDAMRYLVKQRGADVSANVLTGFIQPFDNEVADIVVHFGLNTATTSSETILSSYIRDGGNSEGIETLFSLQINKTSGIDVYESGSQNTLLILTDLHTACSMGDLKIVRLMIINGSDVNELDSYGRPPLAYLPLAPIINYPALQETKTKNVIKKIVFKDFIPLGMTFKKFDLLVSEPGIGDVQNIAELNVNKIHEDAEKAILSLVEKCHILPGTSPWIKRFGSAAEGTKVGIPDEMDFLAVVGSIDQRNIQNSKYDYVHCMNLPIKDSEQFHKLFSNKITQNLHRIKLHKHLVLAQLHIQTVRILKSRRKATTPLRLQWIKEPSYEDVIRGYPISTKQVMLCHVTVSVDVVPSIHVKNWPEGALEKTWLLNHDELKSRGYYIVPKPPHVKSVVTGEFTDKELQDLWKISFPHLETYHMQRLDKRVKDVYLLAKCLRNPDVCRVMVTDNGSYPRSMEKYVTSYMLKMIFFKNVEFFLHSPKLSLGEMVCQVYDELVESLTKGFIPLFFMPHVCAVAGHNVDIAKSARAAKILKTIAHSFYSSDCRGATGDSAESRDQTQSKSVYQSIEIG